ncbi:hypothetical protein C0995_007276 [Termitomyces sp. Mi166|nr:hypothetical protein C0995_007276 [Termitomyces sp. Mi166\
MDRSVSYCLLQLKHARVAAEDDWDSLLSHARFRACSSPVDLDGELHQENEQYPFASEFHMWRVAVKPGYEETATFILMEKTLRSPS